MQIIKPLPLGNQDGNTHSSDIVDLTKLSDTMLFAEFANITYNPKDFHGKTLKIKGNFSVFYNPNTNEPYFAVTITDTLACCLQAIEFILAGNPTFPKDYPPENSPIIVEGQYHIYGGHPEIGIYFARLENARFL